MMPLHEIVDTRTLRREAFVTAEREELDREYRAMVRSILPWWRRIFW